MNPWGRDVGRTGVCCRFFGALGSMLRVTELLSGLKLRGWRRKEGGRGGVTERMLLLMLGLGRVLEMTVRL